MYIKIVHKNKGKGKFTGCTHEAENGVKLREDLQTSAILSFETIQEAIESCLRHTRTGHGVEYRKARSGTRQSETQIYYLNSNQTVHNRPV